MAEALSEDQRRGIHDLALQARDLLTGEAVELLEGTYGLYADGRMDPLAKLPQIEEDAEARETYELLVRFLDDEVEAGLSRQEIAEKLIKEVAFTHLNRLVAFKMMEARKLIRGTVDKGVESNAFKFYLADPDHADDLSLRQQGDVDTAYRHFLLWQSGLVAEEIRVLFDPHNLVSRLFPRPRALHELLDMLNQPELAPAWRADETIGWIYQYFNEPELQAAFEKVRTSGAKFEAKDIPSATQLFTPHWIVRFLVHNTLGRLWVRMHPDTMLAESDVLDYLVPLDGERLSEPLRPVKEITLLDPACGGMHFGLVAFDLFAAMYREEVDRAGRPGWPATPSVANPAEIPATIIKHNLFGIDIDLRAAQLSALALYLKAKSLNPEARITDSNLACADVLPLDGARLGSFLREARFSRPIYERLIRALWERLREVNQLGSLLRLEQEIGDLIELERGQYQKAPLFGGVTGEFETEAAEEEFWELISAQLVQGLDEFARQQARTGVDQGFFTQEATKGLRLLDLMLRRYDVVVTNPPYMSRRKMNKELADLVAAAYPAGKSDLCAAFIQRCLEFAEECGYVGMLTMQSFMFLTSYEGLRQDIRDQAAIETMAHCGPGLFDVGNPGTLQTTACVYRKEPDTERREENMGTYFRLVHAPTGDDKRQAFERALRELREQTVIGILAYGSLLADPGCEIEAAIERRIEGVLTHFQVEYARSSSGRAGAPTLVPVPNGKGANVNAEVLVLGPSVTEREAKNMLYRRETNRVGKQTIEYDDTVQSHPDAVLLRSSANIAGVSRVFYAHLDANIDAILKDDLSAEEKARELAQRAVESVTDETFHQLRDGIQYLSDAISDGVHTPLTWPYERTILEIAGDAPDLETARQRIAQSKGITVKEEA